METQWDRVARWARMGNNKRASESMGTSEETMQDEMREQGGVDVQEPEFVGSPETEQSTAASEATGDASSVEMEQLRGERDQLRDRLARLQAEFDNARKREAKERQDARDYAIQGAVEPFLGVMDNFQPGA